MGYVFLLRSPSCEHDGGSESQDYFPNGQHHTLGVPQQRLYKQASCLWLVGYRVSKNKVTPTHK